MDYGRSSAIVTEVPCARNIAKTAKARWTRRSGGSTRRLPATKGLAHDTRHTTDDHRRPLDMSDYKHTPASTRYSPTQHRQGTSHSHHGSPLPRHPPGPPPQYPPPSRKPPPRVSSQPVPKPAMLAVKGGGGGNRNAKGLPIGPDGQRPWSHGLCTCTEDCGLCACFSSSFLSSEYSPGSTILFPAIPASRNTPTLSWNRPPSKYAD